jgi:Protein of unknown function (DUF1592)/Protein of unknown function (DUF1588)/Protein of unknown function (DUF1585)/Protein of unknown function (DUF1595)
MLRLFQTIRMQSVLRAGGGVQKSALTAALTAILVSCSSPTTPSAPQPQAAARAAPSAEQDGLPRRLRLVTAEQLHNTLSYVFGPNISPPVAFAPVTRTDGLLGVGRSFAGVTASQLELYQKTAATAAIEVVNESNRHFLVPCTPKTGDAPDDLCAKQFLSSVGRMVYRRPLEADRLDRFVADARDAAARLNDFYAGLSIALEGMLLSPRVMMLAERSEPDQTNPGHERLDAYSLASRLSFFLWNAAPDDLLLKAAASGELHAPKGLAKSVDRMLASDRLQVGMRAFFDDMLMLEDFNNLSKDAQIYPQFTGVAVVDAREQTLRMVVDQLVKKNKDYRDIFTTRETFLSPSLAALYRLPATPGWTAYEFPEGSPRMGILTQAAFLAAHSHPGRSSPTLRGKALREILLCQPVPKPPANVDFSLLENPDPNVKTQRDRVAVHLKNPVCAGCHKVTDPMGLALENFDGAGQYRETEKGAKIDASGSMDGKNFADIRELAQVLHDNPAAPQCLARRVYAYGTGSPASAVPRTELAALYKQFEAGAYRLRPLLRNVVMSKAFSKVREETAPTNTAAASASPATARVQ